MTGQRKHLSARFKVCASGIYVNTACGNYVHGCWSDARTDDRSAVTCGACQATKAYRADNSYSVNLDQDPE